MAGDDALEMDAWLWSVPDGRLPPPPVESKAPLLPIGDLAWENAERLFVRLLETQGRIQYAKLFGTPGQNQAGIDAYARLPLDLASAAPDSRAYVALQSRRVKKLTPAGIKRAVKDFLSREWAGRSQRFYFATSANLQERTLDVAVREATDELGEHRIEFIPWGAQELAALLRPHPEIVDDFFGRPWVELFCGRDAASGLRHRLTPQDSTRLRDELRSLYSAVFAAQDARTKPGHDGRFVILDVAPGVPGDDLPQPVGQELEPLADPVPNQHPQALAHFDEHDAGFVTRSRYGQRRRTLRPLRRLLNRPGVPAGTGEMNRPADDWLAECRHALVIGAPGSGKSSLLRFAAGDLLAAEPQSVVLQREHAGRLPVWLPFGYLCRHLAESTTHSLHSAARAWLARHDAENLWQLVERALSDDRLLLLIDGVDEWSDVDEAEHALYVLETFLGRSQAVAIVSTRPYAISRLNWTLPWTRGALTALTDAQRRAIAAQTILTVQGTDDANYTRIRLDPFLEELDEVPELSELSRSPLFLTLLAATWRGEPLPAQRFKLYGRLIELLIEKHPQMRRRATRARGGAISSDEFQTLFQAVAYRLRSRGSAGTVARAEIRGHFREALIDEDVLGYPLEQARRIADAALRVGEHEFGILVSQGAGQVGFLHRVIFDHLAGLHLATLPLQEQERVMIERVADPAWGDVLLSALSAHIVRSHVKSLLDAVTVGTTADLSEPEGAGAVERALWAHRDNSAFELLAQALAANVALTPRQHAAYLDQLIGRVQAHPSLEHRAVACQPDGTTQLPRGRDHLVV
ncbi:NACHT domain-containing protein [Sphaerisporangium sp. NPDC049003]|uniref:NACHT domain-containing protein n=1 Tax=Sphaerisporangium sp. NPDC049003 TaxID=3364517 RepID=UPI00371FD81F